MGERQRDHAHVSTCHSEQWRHAANVTTEENDAFRGQADEGGGGAGSLIGLPRPHDGFPNVPLSLAHVADTAQVVSCKPTHHTNAITHQTAHPHKNRAYLFTQYNRFSTSIPSVMCRKPAPAQVLPHAGWLCSTLVVLAGSYPKGAHEFQGSPYRCHGGVGPYTSPRNCTHECVPA